jgi:ribonuclease VapC
VIVDSSAVVAVVLAGPGHESLVDPISADGRAGIGGPTLAETGIVLSAKLGVAGQTLLVRFLEEADVDVVPFGEEHWLIAVEAFRRYGKGRHPASLNFGDCLTYATARLASEPLLALGDDFAQTDLELVR